MRQTLEAEIAYRRGSIMAHCIPAQHKDGVRSRPLGINPYPIATDEYAAWQIGYSEETEAMIAKSEARAEVAVEYDEEKFRAAMRDASFVGLTAGKLESELTIE